jgi:hypothetical protein
MNVKGRIKTLEKVVNEKTGAKLNRVYIVQARQRTDNPDLYDGKCEDIKIEGVCEKDMSHELDRVLGTGPEDVVHVIIIRTIVSGKPAD